jgi:hypothetical protein
VEAAGAAVVTGAAVVLVLLAHADKARSPVAARTAVVRRIMLKVPPSWLQRTPTISMRC